MDLLRLIGYCISVTFWFIRYTGRENIPPNDSDAYLIAANHQTYIDPVWICLPIRRRMRFMAFDKAFNWRFIGPLITYLGAFPVSLDVGGTLRAMKTAVRTLEEGAVLTVFPEGAREFADGEMFPFKTGAVRIAFEAGVPILPVTVSGANRIWPQGRKYPKLFRRVDIIYHPLLELPASSGDSHRDLESWTNDLRQIIASDQRLSPGD